MLAKKSSLMSRNTLTQSEQIQLSGISWNTYQSLLQDLGDRHLRLMYYCGNLEIMVPSPEHEFYKKLVGRFVETIAEELKISIYPLGSTTFNRQDLNAGGEPDECFYIRNQGAVKGKTRLNLTQDPPPDLVIEIDITSSSTSRWQIYAALGVPEIWRYDGAAFTISLLQDQAYISSDRSLAFPNLPISEISQFLQQAMTMDYLELVTAWRAWVRSQIQQIKLYHC